MLLLTKVGAWFGSKLTGALPYLIAVVAALGFLVKLFTMVRNGGRAEAVAEGATNIIKDVETRHEVDAAVAVTADPAAELRKHWSRD